MNAVEYTDYLVHHGIKGQKWGVRRFQNEDGSLTPEGKERYGVLQIKVDPDTWDIHLSNADRRNTPNLYRFRDEKLKEESKMIRLASQRYGRDSREYKAVCRMFTYHLIQEVNSNPERYMTYNGYAKYVKDQKNN